MEKHFKAIGISYKNTPLELRESVSFDENQNRTFLAQLKEMFAIEDALLVSTCNRTELYYYSDRDLSTELAKLIDIFHQNDGSTATADHFVKYEHDEAINHLFEVALGLDSMILGDIQISNQIKKAYQYAADEGTAGPFLHRLMHTIFFTNKRSVQETSIHDGTASVASAAVDVANKFMVNYSQPKIVVLGLGEIGVNVAENLKGTDAQVILVNRTYETAETKASQLGFDVAHFENLPDVLQNAHVVISAVQASTPLVNSELIGDTDHPRLFIDLSVPRSIEKNLDELPGILLYNVDQLEQKTAEALNKRKEAIQDVKTILSESIADFESWSQEMGISPAIKKFKNALEEIRQEELARFLSKADDKHAKMLEDITKNMVQKLVKLPVLQLKAACKRGEAEEMATILQDLFNLEAKETNTPK
ncbi:MAG: glutamyl-tRNA reductase [Cyclobacteriaceae bacterium]